jgi:hypothetical protein
MITATTIFTATTLSPHPAQSPPFPQAHPTETTVFPQLEQPHSLCCAHTVIQQMLHPAQLVVRRFAWRGAFLMDQFSSWNVGNALWDDMVKDTINLSSIVWSRLEILFGTWPWRLMRNDRATFTALLAEKPCCVDEWLPSTH